ncbi:MAG: ecdysteroid 22-kinase family protein [Actinomycetia bacterium]|nr:ecdysteroid 22-kinase family protein [Actinomycetes bacterium]
MTERSIPLQPEDFDAALVQRLICSKHPGVGVAAIRLVDAALSSDGEQRVSTARRITFDIDYSAEVIPPLPTRLTIKVARPGLGDLPLYDNEVNVYDKLAGELPVVMPQCLGAVRNRATSSFGLVMEDLRANGAEFPDVLTPTDADGIKRLLDQLALLHARYWESPRFETDLAWVQPHTSGPIHDLFSHQAGVPMLISWEVQSRQFKRELLESVNETVDSLLRKVAAAQAHQAALPTTLVHGDCHIGNTFALPDGRRGLLDWQLTARGFCMHDVSYLIITGLSVADRRSNEDDLINYYRSRLAAAGVTDAPSFEDLRAEHRLAAAWCFCIGWLTTPLENYGWEINVANHIRLATAYRDLESKQALEALS